jgi:transaldolase
MRPSDLKTRIFLDGGNPEETREALTLLGFLDGQTTNPTLISKNPEACDRFKHGHKFTKREVYTFYEKVVREISGLIPHGSVSVEVYADGSTGADEMLSQGIKMFSWIPNAHIKYPITGQGLSAAEQAVKEGIRVNLTLCFSQEQAAAVHAATMGPNKGDVFVSPFIGRLDDKGENGMDLISNVLRMYGKGDGHVEVLTASVRNIDHFLYALKLGSDIITSPFKVLKEWAGRGLPVPGSEYTYNSDNLTAIPYTELDLTRGWQGYNIRHELTDKGIELFSKDWNSMIG